MRDPVLLKGEPDIEHLSDQSKGLLLALSSSIFIGSSYVVKKKGLRLAGSSGLRAGGNSWPQPPFRACGQITVNTQLTPVMCLQEVEATPMCCSRCGGQAC